MLDRPDPELVVDPGVDLAVGGSVAAGELGDEPVALVPKPGALFERRRPVWPGLAIEIRGEVGLHLL